MATVVMNMHLGSRTGSLWSTHSPRRSGFSSGFSISPGAQSGLLPHAVARPTSATAAVSMDRINRAPERTRSTLNHVAKSSHILSRRDNRGPCQLKLPTMTTELPRQLHENGAKRALDWLMDRHRKGMNVAFKTLLDQLFTGGRADAVNQLDADAMEALQINLSEWLLAEGSLQLKRGRQRIVDHLLGPAGPAFTPNQQRWLAQLAQQPLRLYTVTDVRPGVGVTLCDALDPGAAPIKVDEVSGSRQMAPGLLLGCRVISEGGRSVLSGAMYPISLLAGPRVQAELQAEIQHDAQDGAHAAAQSAAPDGQPGELKTRLGLCLMKAWLRQFTEPPPMPRFINADSGEPLLLITDHYRVLDWPALGAALAGCGDVQGSREAGWKRAASGADGQMRSLVAINLGKQPDRIEPFYRSQTAADAGRIWLDGVAGASVRWLTREITDPAGALAHAPPAMPGSAPASPPLPPGLSPDVAADAIEQMLHRTYARWADKPLPALAQQTPRQCIATEPGLERVKGLLRGYEHSEAAMAAQQGRRTVSLDFLWTELGITR